MPVRFQTLSSKIKAELYVFENEWRRGDYLKRTYSFLMTIKTTGVESGRALPTLTAFKSSCHFAKVLHFL